LADGGAPEPAESAGVAGAWLELSVAADVEAVEAVSEILSRVAPGGATVEPAFELVEEGLAARLDPSRPSIVRAYVPARDPVAAERAAATAAEALGHLQAFGLRTIGDVTTRVVQEADWAEAWKAHFPVLRVGRRLVIRPTWLEHEPGPDDVVVDLDPGMAFGTGLHPTTRLCLAAIEAVADRGLLEGATVLDVGCGSGILSIAAAKLGAAHVLGVDIDPIAIEATRANAATNGEAGRIDARVGSLPSGDGPHDVVLANLIASVLVALAPALRDELRPGGIVVASGIYVDREDEVRSALEAAGLRVGDRTAEGDWVALEVTRTAARQAGGGESASGPAGRVPQIG
jgi:ribosomal protein L11 methyltransferase